MQALLIAERRHGTASHARQWHDAMALSAVRRGAALRAMLDRCRWEQDTVPGRLPPPRTPPQGLAALVQKPEAPPIGRRGHVGRGRSHLRSAVRKRSRGVRSEHVITPEDNGADYMSVEGQHGVEVDGESVCAGVVEGWHEGVVGRGSWVLVGGVLVGG